MLQGEFPVRGVNCISFIATGFICHDSAGACSKNIKLCSIKFGSYITPTLACLSLIFLYSCLRPFGLFFYTVRLIFKHLLGPNSSYSFLILSRQEMVMLGWDRLRFVHPPAHSHTSFRAIANECEN